MARKKDVPDNIMDTAIGNGVEYVLRLYITGASPNSGRAITNIKKICDTHLQGRHQLTITDVYQQHELVRTEQIIALPMLLVKRSSAPDRRLIGDMSDTEKVLRGLGITL